MSARRKEPVLHFVFEGDLRLSRLGAELCILQSFERFLWFACSRFAMAYRPTAPSKKEHNSN